MLKLRHKEARKGSSIDLYNISPKKQFLHVQARPYCTVDGVNPALP